MKTPFKTKMMPEKWYHQLDPGIRFAVRVLHAAGLETCQSCQGGPDPQRPDRGHAYDRPTIDLPAGTDDSYGFRALSACAAFGLKVRDLSIVWNIHGGAPYEKLWRITFWETYEERANERPNFVTGFQAQ